MNPIAKIVAAALLSFTAVNVIAFVPSNDGAADIVVRHSGATSSSQSLLRAVISLCHPDGDNHVFDSEVAGSGDRTDFFDSNNRHDGDYFVVACEVADGITTIVEGAADPASPIPNDVELNLSGGPGSGTDGRFTMLYYKRDVGGSVMGVEPLAKNADVGFMSIDPAVCPADPPNRWIDCADTPTLSYVAPAHVGTSTVEPAIFTAPENMSTNDIDWNNDGLANNPQTTRFEIAALTTVHTSYLTFGVPANYRLYTALQYAQFPSGHPEFDDCNPAGLNYGDLSVDTNNAASEKCMPNLSKQQINSLFVTNRTSSDMLSKLFAPVTFGSDMVQSVWDFIPETGGPYARDTYQGDDVSDDFVAICRGTEGTGTTAQHSLFYHNFPCDRDFADFNIDGNVPDFEAPFGPFRGTRESTGSARVSDCLLAFDNGSNPGTNSPNPDGSTLAAIGLQSAVRGNAEEDDDHNWRYLKIDGHAPSLKNAHAGKYEQVYAESWQTSPNATGNELEVINTLIKAFSTHEFLVPLNDEQTFGTVGWLANSGTGKCDDCAARTTLEGPGGTSRPVYPFIRQEGSGEPQSCATPRASQNANEGIIIGD